MCNTVLQMQQFRSLLLRHHLVHIYIYIHHVSAIWYHHQVYDILCKMLQYIHYFMALKTCINLEVFL
jgi:hypothetical protein